MPPPKRLQDALEDDASSLELVVYCRGDGGPHEVRRVGRGKTQLLEEAKKRDARYRL